jgi:hypothetical protein
MMTDLWDWQDADAERLRSEHKLRLVEWWERFYDIATDDGSELLKAANQAREVREPRWEVFFLHWHVQASLYWGGAAIEPLLALEERLLELADHPDCQSIPQHFCARLALARAAADREQWNVCRRYAEEAARAATGRQASRFAAEAFVLLGTAARGAGDVDLQGVAAASLTDWVPRLRSRDLDASARALGATV